MSKRVKISATGIISICSIAAVAILVSVAYFSIISKGNTHRRLMEDYVSFMDECLLDNEKYKCLLRLNGIYDRVHSHKKPSEDYLKYIRN